MTMQIAPLYQFKKGDRVRPSELGIERNIFPALDQQRRLGTVTGFTHDAFPCPVIRWDGRKSSSGGYHPDFIEIVRD